MKNWCLLTLQESPNISRGSVSLNKKMGIGLGKNSSTSLLLKKESLPTSASQAL